MTLIILTFTSDNRLEIRGPADLRHDRELTADDFARFRQWSETYRQALRPRSNADALKTLGEDMYRWLDGDARCLGRIHESVEMPLLLEFTVVRDPNEEQRLFLDAPWELLADDKGHLAGRDTLAYCPLRRLGRRDEPSEPSPYSLSCLSRSGPSSSSCIGSNP